MSLTGALTIDVEDYFQIHALSNVIRPEDWDSLESRVEKNTHHVLDLLDCVEDQRSEIGGQKSEVRGRRSEVGGQKTEGRGQRAEDRGQKAEYKILKRSNKTKKVQNNPVSIIEHQASSSPKATFFVLGWIAQRFPALVREIHSRGHEVACHGYTHQLVNTQTRESFSEDVTRAKHVLEDLIGFEVLGYRAPSFSITKDTLWALEILFHLGFRYDSSIFPIKHDFYGFSGAPRYPFVIDFSDSNLISQLKNPKYLHDASNAGNINAEKSEDSMPHVYPVKFASGDNFTGALCAARDLDRDRDRFIEFPPSTFSIFGLNIPCSGGGYFRLLPYWLTKWGLKQMNKNGLGTAIFYLHPWELDPDLPHIQGSSYRAKFRTYVNLKKTEPRFKRLLNDFRCVSLGSIL